MGCHGPWSCVRRLRRLENCRAQCMASRRTGEGRTLWLRHMPELTVTNEVKLQWPAARSTRAGLSASALSSLTGRDLPEAMVLGYEHHFEGCKEEDNNKGGGWRNDVRGR